MTGNGLQALQSRVEALEKVVAELTAKAVRRKQVDVSFPLFEQDDETHGFVVRVRSVLTQAEEGEEAEQFLKGLCARLASKRQAFAEDVFIRTFQPGNEKNREVTMIDHWAAIFGRRLSYKGLVSKLKRHLLLGRMRGLRKGRHKKTTIRGFYVSAAMLNEWIKCKK